MGFRDVRSQPECAVSGSVVYLHYNFLQVEILQLLSRSHVQRHALEEGVIEPGVGDVL